MAASLFARGAERISKRSLRTLVTKRRMSEMGQTEKHSARADVFRSCPKSGHWFGMPENISADRMLWNFRATEHYRLQVLAASASQI